LWRRNFLLGRLSGRNAAWDIFAVVTVLKGGRLRSAAEFFAWSLTPDVYFRTVFQFSSSQNARKMRRAQGKTALAPWLLCTATEPKHNVSVE